MACQVRQRPFLIPLLGLMGGFCATHHFDLTLPYWLAWLCLAGSSALIFFRSAVPLAIAVGLTFFAWGASSLAPFLHPELVSTHIVRSAGRGAVIIEGIVDSRPDIRPGEGKFRLAAESVMADGAARPASGRLMVYVKEGMVPFLTGDRVRFRATVAEPFNYGIPGEYDYRRHLAYRDIHATAFVRHADDILLMRQAVAFPVQRFFDRSAAMLGDVIGRYSPREGGVLRALLLGERGFVSKELEEAYTRAGVNHILSISGFHVGIIALVIYRSLLMLLSRFERLALHLNLRRTALLATLPPVTFYLFLSGAAPATVRSVLMIAVVTVALWLERETDPVNVLIMAALAMLAANPPSLFDISFQLSFLALWGLVVLTPVFIHPLRTLDNRAAKNVILLLAASAAATLATILPVGYAFHRASAAGIISNVFIVPLMGYGAVVAGFAALPLIAVAPAAAGPLITVASWLVALSNRIIDLLARIPPLPLHSVTRTDLLVSFLLLLGLTLLPGRRARMLTAGIAAVVLSTLHLPAVAGGDAMLVLTFLSVGQGESTLVSLPHGKTMLVDGGGALHGGGTDVGERLLVPALRSMGVASIDYLVLTHPHPDHLEGLLYLAAAMPVGEFWETGLPTESASLAELRDRLAQRGVPVKHLSAATSPFTVGGARVEPLWPPGNGTGKGGDNDDSLVFRLVHGDTSILFTGDIGAPAEGILANDPARLRCTVLKVPHHGSRYSSSPSFLDAASPHVALISAGRRNSFGLPAPETLGRLETRGIDVYRTDRDGTVQVICTGKTWDVGTFANGHFR